MQLKELFRTPDVLVGFKAQDKWDAIERIIRHLESEGRFGSDQTCDLLEAVLGRERSMSTGMEHGLAMPHAAVEGLEDVVASLAICSEADALDFESTDASATRMVVLLLIPKKQKLLHIRTLAEIARLMSKSHVRQTLLGATDSATAWGVLEG
jgi:mannitol/fructose-specific phosphotransferase system IIA component (Ntr-type)